MNLTTKEKRLAKASIESAQHRLQAFVFWLKDFYIEKNGEQYYYCMEGLFEGLPDSSMRIVLEKISKYASDIQILASDCSALASQAIDLIEKDCLEESMEKLKEASRLEQNFCGFSFAFGAAVSLLEELKRGFINE